MKLFLITLIIAALGAGFFFLYVPRKIVIDNGSGVAQIADSGNSVPVLEVPEAPETPSSTEAQKNGNGDIEKQPWLPNPPTVVKAVYATGWSAGSVSRKNALISLIKKNELNGIVIDIKDYSGYVSYKTGIPEVAGAGAEKEIRILRPNALIKELHDAGIYVIARVTVFQDPILARAHPEWALKDKVTGKTWADNHKLSWIDPAAEGAWDYVAAIAKDASSRGFDEINFDYVRFPSDGALENATYPFWNGANQKHEQIAKFFRYLRKELSGITISADLFGLTTVAIDDLGIGQVIEDAYASFDYVSPMIYPSHYSAGFIGYKNPAQYPYEVVRYSLENGTKKLATMIRKMTAATSTATTSTASTSSQASSVISHQSLAKLRPWLQVFDMGAVYDKGMIQAQIKATEDVLLHGSSTDAYAGWLLWDPANRYERL
ncbi:MAG: hypothetical protein A2946_00585 [Candidatus Liptonbacteria bacterium RIFCSPLOWO2_01_FULL_53_13]|uniref:DUF4015 domain-containing protein n=1 Tax=Candidatus Liptonbacteria bacterium RIFCSPLOWO2_01_FULL_53_13 TaxID=1798651 RepID=A0A1G2CJS7_9BACT|nr:MAG: hypothetical protein A2946_00585 [Candidatus Liptonbacteria bacterium RIFCSPLOWO2_01_FULL_53_13]